MSAVHELTAAGLTVALVEEDKLKLSGLDRLSQDEAAWLVAYARRNKARILRELQEDTRRKLLADFALEIRHGRVIDLLTGEIVGLEADLAQVVVSLGGLAGEVMQ